MTLERWVLEYEYPQTIKMARLLADKECPYCHGNAWREEFQSEGNAPHSGFLIPSRCHCVPWWRLWHKEKYYQPLPPIQGEWVLEQTFDIQGEPW